MGPYPENCQVRRPQISKMQEKTGDLGAGPVEDVGEAKTLTLLWFSRDDEEMSIFFLSKNCLDHVD